MPLESGYCSRHRGHMHTGMRHYFSCQGVYSIVGHEARMDIQWQLLFLLELLQWKGSWNFDESMREAAKPHFRWPRFSNRMMPQGLMAQTCCFGRMGPTDTEGLLLGGHMERLKLPPIRGGGSGTTQDPRSVPSLKPDGVGQRLPEETECEQAAALLWRYVICLGK